MKFKKRHVFLTRAVFWAANVNGPLKSLPQHDSFAEIDRVWSGETAAHLVRPLRYAELDSVLFICLCDSTLQSLQQQRRANRKRVSPFGMAGSIDLERNISSMKQMQSTGVSLRHLRLPCVLL